MRVGGQTASRLVRLATRIAFGPGSGTLELLPRKSDKTFLRKSKLSLLLLRVAQLIFGPTAEIRSSQLLLWYLRGEHEQAAKLAVSDLDALLFNSELTALLLARVLAANGDFESARRIVARTRNTRPDFKAPRSEEIGWLIDRGETEEAARLNDELLGRDPNWQPGWYHKGCIEINKGKYPHAEAAFNRALELRPHDDRSRYGLGIAQMLQHRWNEVAQTFEGITAPSDPVAHARILIFCYSLIDDPAKAADWTRRAISIVGPSADLVEILAESLFKLGLHAESEALRRQISPDGSIRPDLEDRAEAIDEEGPSTLPGRRSELEVLRSRAFARGLTAVLGPPFIGKSELLAGLVRDLRDTSGVSVGFARGLEEPISPLLRAAADLYDSWLEEAGAEDQLRFLFRTQVHSWPEGALAAIEAVGPILQSATPKLLRPLQSALIELGKQLKKTHRFLRSGGLPPSLPVHELVRRLLLHLNAIEPRPQVLVFDAIDVDAERSTFLGFLERFLAGHDPWPNLHIIFAARSNVLPGDFESRTRNLFGQFPGTKVLELGPLQFQSELEEREFVDSIRRAAPLTGALPSALLVAIAKSNPSVIRWWSSLKSESRADPVLVLQQAEIASLASAVDLHEAVRRVFEIGPSHFDILASVCIVADDEGLAERAEIGRILGTDFENEIPTLQRAGMLDAKASVIHLPTWISPNAVLSYSLDIPAYRSRLVPLLERFVERRFELAAVSSSPPAFMLAPAARLRFRIARTDLLPRALARNLRCASFLVFNEAITLDEVLLPQDELAQLPPLHLHVIVGTAISCAIRFGPAATQSVLDWLDLFDPEALPVIERNEALTASFLDLSLLASSVGHLEYGHRALDWIAQLIDASLPTVSEESSLRVAAAATAAAPLPRRLERRLATLLEELNIRFPDREPLRLAQRALTSSIKLHDIMFAQPAAGEPTRAAVHGMEGEGHGEGVLEREIRRLEMSIAQPLVFDLLSDLERSRALEDPSIKGFVRSLRGGQLNAPAPPVEALSASQLASLGRSLRVLRRRFPASQLVRQKSAVVLAAQLRGGFFPERGLQRALRMLTELFEEDANDQTTLKAMVGALAAIQVREVVSASPGDRSPSLDGRSTLNRLIGELQGRHECNPDHISAIMGRYDEALFNHLLCSAEATTPAELGPIEAAVRAVLSNLPQDQAEECDAQFQIAACVAALRCGAREHLLAVLGPIQAAARAHDGMALGPRHYAQLLERLVEISVELGDEASRREHFSELKGLAWRFPRDSFIVDATARSTFRIVLGLSKLEAASSEARDAAPGPRHSTKAPSDRADFGDSQECSSSGEAIAFLLDLEKASPESIGAAESLAELFFLEAREQQSRSAKCHALEQMLRRLQKFPQSPRIAERTAALVSALSRALLNFRPAAAAV